jgi:hypothetical protein
LFAWLNVSWANIALTILGVLLIIFAFIKTESCCMVKKPKSE